MSENLQQEFERLLEEEEDEESSSTTTEAGEADE
jgi:hypothetical protein